jgi:hypothetical protein
VGNEAIEMQFLARPAPKRLEPIAEDTERPHLYVITTPREMREEWETWCAIRRELIVSLFIVAALIGFMFVV